MIHKSIPFQMDGIIQDPSGRYLIVQGKLLTKPLNLVNIYGPNDDIPKFYSNLFLTLFTFSGFYVMGGDFNCTLDPIRDRSSGLDQSHKQTRKTLHYFIKDLTLLKYGDNYTLRISSILASPELTSLIPELIIFLFQQKLCHISLIVLMIL